MRIKLAILENDHEYLNRIVSAFNTKYSEKFEIYSFTDPNIAISTLSTSRINVLIASDSFTVETDMIPKNCGFAYLVDSTDIDQINGQRAICRYQKIDLIYKQILSVYSESAGNISNIKLGEEDTKILVFCSASGGTGTSSMAAASAIYFANRNKKALYLNLEKLGSSDVFFSGEGRFNMSDIVFSLKSKKANLQLKLESSVKQDESGVYFYSQSKHPLDMCELNGDEIVKLITQLELVGSYDYIIVDIDYTCDEDMIKVLNKAHRIIWTCDGMELSNHKIQRAYSALSVLEKIREVSLTSKLCIIYNKFSNKIGKKVGEVEIRCLGGAPRYEHATTAQILEKLSQLDNVFSQII